MTKRHTYITCLSLLVVFFIASNTVMVNAQTDSVRINGVVIGSGTDSPLHMVSVSDAGTGVSTSTNEKGEFSLVLLNRNSKLIFNLPGYTKRDIFLSGRTSVEVYLVPSQFKSTDKELITPIDKFPIKNVSYAVVPLNGKDVDMSTYTSFDQSLQGKVAGLLVTDKSGMPGQRTYMNIRGMSSLFGNNEPIVFIDGMIHNYSYANGGIIEGFQLNPLDVVDMDDVMDITVMKDGVSFIGSSGSNGVVNINTEQEGETSTRIKFSAYGGIASTPEQLDVMNSSQFNNYFGEVLGEQGYLTSQINSMYPWLNGNTSAKDYYRYNNSTNWQDEILKPAALQKYHFFLKGGDDIATYNISTGYLKQDGIYDNSAYSRFNLRINGKINITKRFSVKPNVKLSLANSSIANNGYSTWKNPLTSALLKPSLMAPNAKDALSGISLPYLDDVGSVFGVSNPVAITNNAIGSNVNYVFMSSLKATYDFSEHLSVSTLLGTDYNNAHEDIFLPNLGLVQVDSAANSPQYGVSEFQSFQNHSVITYKNNTATGHSYAVNGGFRMMKNKYKNNYAIDLNTASDQISSLGGGGRYSYLRTVGGDETGLVWVSYFGSVNYNFQNKYFLDANVSYDGSSVLEGDNRYNFYPSLAAGWSPIDLIKLRASWSVTGNMFSSIYSNSQTYYTSRRLNEMGVIVRESIANPNIEIEKKTSYNIGADLSFFKQKVNLAIDAYQANTNNLLVYQQLMMQSGYTDYVDNGGELKTTGLELAVNTRLHFGSVVWTAALTAASQTSEMMEISFLNPAVNKVVTEFEGGAMVTQKGGVPNAFYGYKTNGIYDTDAEASKVIGPNQIPMQAGDVIFSDVDGNHKIDEADKMIIGDPNPDFFGGFFTSVKVKSLEISAQLNYSVGNEAFNYVRYQTESMSTYANQSISVLNRWTAPGTSQTMPRASYGDPTGNTVFSDRWIEDASFVRLKQLTVSYDLPSFFGFRGLTVYTTATNLFTLTKYSGFDPEFQYSNNPFYMGVDYGQMPHAKKFIVGLKLDL